MSEPTSGSDATRKIVEQRRPGEPTGSTGAAHPWWEGPDTFATPSWVGPDRHPDRPAPGRPAGRPGAGIPAQSAPTHDRLEVADHAAPDVPLEAHWKGTRLGRRTLGSVLAVASAAALVTGVLTVLEHSADLLTLFGVCALAAVGTWGLMGSMKPMTVDLKGPMLTVHHHNTSETFDLSHPFQVVHIRGAVDSPTWTLTLVRDDGTDLAVGARSVPPAEMHPIVMHYRARAEERLRDRKRRFTL